MKTLPIRAIGDLPLEKPRCSTCIHWNKSAPYASTMGVCEAEPPRIRESSIPGVWRPPMTQPHQGCARHQDFPAYERSLRPSEATAADVEADTPITGGASSARLDPHANPPEENLADRVRRHGREFDRGTWDQEAEADAVGFFCKHFQEIAQRIDRGDSALSELKDFLDSWRPARDRFGGEIPLGESLARNVVPALVGLIDELRNALRSCLLGTGVTMPAIVRRNIEDLLARTEPKK